MAAAASMVILIGGNAALILLLAASVILHLRVRSAATLTLVAGNLIALAGLVIQVLAPMQDISYIRQGGEIVGATGGFSSGWYLGRVIFTTGLIIAAGALLTHAIVDHRKGDSANPGGSGPQADP